MSHHKTPLTDLERQGLRKYGYAIGYDSQLSDAFREGIAWALSQQTINSPQADSMMLESLIDHVCLKAAEIHNLGKFVSDTDAQNVINEIRAMLSAYKPQADDRF